MPEALMFTVQHPYGMRGEHKHACLRVGKLREDNSVDLLI